MTLAYFCLSSLALLPASAISTAPEDSERSALELMIKDDVKMEFIDWVYDRQELSGGFRGGSSMDKLDLAPKDSAQEGGGTLNDLFSGGAGSIPGLIPLSEDEELEYQQLMAFPSSPTSSSAPSLLFPTTVSQFSPPNLIQSYTALLVLGLLGDDFKRLNKSGLIRFIARCQNDDGSISQFPGAQEPGDPRSIYSGFAISSILNDWSGVDVDAALAFTDRCRRPEGGYATRPNLEPQGGTTYCAIASYSLASRLSTVARPASTLRWLLSRQVLPPKQEDDDHDDSSDESIKHHVTTMVETEESAAGFQGRVGKDTDACYSFWCSAAILMLSNRTDLIDERADREWLLSCQSLRYGGIARDRDSPPDVYHTYLSLAAFSLHRQVGLYELDADWNVGKNVKERMTRSMERNNVESDGI